MHPQTFAKGKRNLREGAAPFAPGPIFGFMQAFKTLGWIAALSALSFAAPIRVGIFTGVGQYLVHSSTSTATAVINEILANPAEANLGSNLVLPPQGFHVAGYGGALAASTTPTTEQASAFVAALDSLDVVLVLHYEANGSLAANVFTPAQKEKIESFIRTRGLVSIHATVDGSGSHWPQWDAFHGTRMRGIPGTDRAGTLRLDTLIHNDPSGRQLNQGLADTIRLTEEWTFFLANGDSLRRVPHLKVSTVLNEGSLAGGLGGQTAMGDHPFSWYRAFPEGGRFFYTALGHRPGSWTGSGSGATPEGTAFVRRQVYNAIVWAAKRDSTGNPVGLNRSRNAGGHTGPALFSVRSAGSRVWIEAPGRLPYTVEIRALDGTLLQRRQGNGEMAFHLKRGSVFILSVSSASGRSATRVFVP